MNYTQAIAWLYETQYSGIKLGLEQIQRLLDALNWNGKQQRFLHVAGTNGKGSVCAMLDAVCRAQGIRTGLYTSPHLVSFCERIRLDGVMISEEEVTQGLTRIREIIADWETQPTFFEITTALALDYFQRWNAEVVVLETGLGGRLDSTNVVTPRVSVITAIDLDHQQWLGSTLREIASEKAGIIKKGVPVISAPQHASVEKALLQSAAEKETSIHFISDTSRTPEVNLHGSHQKLNAAIALAALRTAGIDASDEACRSGLQNVQWPGRFQIFENNIVLDGAHNEAAASRLVATWREVFGEDQPAIILGVLKDKDTAAICHALASLAGSFIAVPVRSPRTFSTTELLEVLRSEEPGVELREAPDFPTALEIARMTGRKILVTGSLFLVGEALAHLEAAPGKPEITLQ